MTDGQYLKQVGSKIRATRKAKGLSMRELAIIAPVHKSSLSDIENGKMNCKILALRKLADTLEVDVKDFL